MDLWKKYEHDRDGYTMAKTDFIRKWTEEARKIYNFCGSKSGRDLDKCEATGLKPVVLEGGSIGFEQARLTLECRKLYKDSMSAEKFIDKDLLQWYGAKGGFHDVYVVEITHAYAE